MRSLRRLAFVLACVGVVLTASGCATNYRETDPFGVYRRAGDYGAGAFPDSYYYTGYYGRPWARNY